jgi:enoyl-CoA hydratase/carnithine racemase
LTRDLLLTGRRISATEAHGAGIVDALVPDGAALHHALSKAREYMGVAPLALAATKSALARRPTSLEDALAIEADLQAPLRMSEDHKLATRAFLEKRPVQFSGR